MDLIEILKGLDDKSSKPIHDYVPIIQSRDGRLTTIYLTEEISVPSEYNKACLTLESAVEVIENRMYAFIRSRHNNRNRAFF